MIYRRGLGVLAAMLWWMISIFLVVSSTTTTTTLVTAFVAHLPTPPQQGQSSYTSTVDTVRVSCCGMLERDTNGDDASPATNNHSSYYLLELLTDYGWDDRLVKLSSNFLPRTAEIQHEGQMRMVSVVDLEFSVPEKPTKLVVDLVEDIGGQKQHDDNAVERIKVDIGQVTTIWNEEYDYYSPSLRETTPISIRRVDDVLDQLYDMANPHASGRRQGGGGWSKKDLQRIIDQIPTTCSFAEKDVMQATLRQVAKAGPRHTRLLDSLSLCQSFSSFSKKQDGKLERARAARLLTEIGGGRFKRFPSLVVASDTASGVLWVVNGGWIAVDSAVRASAEAKGLAQAKSSRGTNADERIIQRLEALAMISLNDEGKISMEGDLEVDVREFLKAASLPCNSQGAEQALINLGIWSADDTSTSERRFKPQPWSLEVLEAVEWYKSMNEKRQARLWKELDSGERTSSKRLEGRIDLTALPCVCVDAARTSFRDDAIGVRPRVSTGRKVINSAKWELLLHTADVSDLYIPETVRRAPQLAILQTAAAKRGSSRYDLPSGPLHLLPPALLDTLALTTRKPGSSSSQLSSFNRCVTIWVYLDESNGKILDAGVERTLISAPLALTFQSATDILDDHKSEISRDLKKAQALLKLAEREVNSWKSRQFNKASTKAREDRLQIREELDSVLFGDSQEDDGRGGFKRTRGHRLVGNCLDLQGFILSSLVRRAKHSLPFVSGTQRDGRVATAPLRRFIDGVAQRQALSVLCGYGGEPYSQHECVEIGIATTNTLNALANIQSFKSSATSAEPKSLHSSARSLKQQQAARALHHRMSSAKHDEDSTPTFLAASTGKQSEVIILEVGAVAFCSGIHGTLKPGQKIEVEIRDIDVRSGKIKATCLDPKTRGGNTGEFSSSRRRRCNRR